MAEARPERFCVGADPNPRLQAKSVRGLRAMVRLGRLAQAVLDDLERDGHSERRSYWLRFHGPCGQGKCYPEGPDTFLAYRSVTRDKVRKYGSWKLRVGGKVPDSRGSGFEYESYELVLEGPFLSRTRGGVAWRYESHVIGKVRVTGSSGTVHFGTASWSSHEGKRHGHSSVRLLKEPCGWRLVSMARAVADWLVKDPEDGFTRPESAEFRKLLPGWLHEDGTAERWSRELWQLLKERKVAAEVMRA